MATTKTWTTRPDLTVICDNRANEPPMAKALRKIDGYAAAARVAWIRGDSENPVDDLMGAIDNMSSVARAALKEAGL